MSTAYDAKYFAFELTKRCASDSMEKLAASLADAQVDLNPHQVEAALFGLPDCLSHLKIATKCVGKLDLARRLALHLEQSRACDNDSRALSTRDCNVQAV
jgi:hypothetical protein